MVLANVSLRLFADDVADDRDFRRRFAHSIGCGGGCAVRRGGFVVATFVQPADDDHSDDSVFDSDCCGLRKSRLCGGVQSAESSGEPRPEFTGDCRDGRDVAAAEGIAGAAGQGSLASPRR